MKIDDHTTLYRIQRCLDGFFTWMTILFVLVISRQVFRTDGSLSFIVVVPVFGMAWAAVGYPEVPGADEWSLVRIRLRVATLIWAGCAPLVVFWSRQPDNLYLLANCFVCLIGGAMTVLQMTRMLRLLCLACDAEPLAKEAKITYNLVFWISLVITCGGGIGVMTIGLVLSSAQPLQLLRACLSLGTGHVDPGTLRFIWVAVMMILFSPIIFFVSVTFRTRMVAHFNLIERLKGDTPHEN